MTTNAFTIPETNIATTRGDRPEAPATINRRDAAVKLFMQPMAFSAAADYSCVAVLKVGDRIDDHVYTYNGTTAKFHDLSHRQIANAVVSTTTSTA